MITQKFTKSLHKGTKLSIVLSLTLLLVACSASSEKNRNDLAHTLKSSQDEFESMVNSLDTKEKIMSQYANWKGVKYRLGGSTRKGIDCSGFVQLTFKEKFGIELPRSTRAQQTIGKKIDKQKLIMGDIVVFNAGSTGRHVGIYVGNSKFVHASTSIGVTISDMNDKYWKNRFNEARRVLKASNIKSANLDKIQLETLKSADSKTSKS